MKYSNTIEYNIKTSLDSKGLTQLKNELQGLELKLQKLSNENPLGEKSFGEARDQIQGLRRALTDAFNPSLGMLDLSKLNKELLNNEVSAQGLKKAFTTMGADGQIAFNNLIGELGKLDTGIKRSNSQVDKLFTTFSNTFRWGLVSSFFSNFMNGIHQSVEYVKELDDSLTQIMLVTDYNRDSMNQYAKSANEAAKALSMSTTGMTNASLIFAQQGYNLEQSQDLATLSAKLANASQQETSATSDQITAYMNAYGLQNDMAGLKEAMDNWALIANISAADVEEIAQASQRAASMANAVGMSGEALAAQIATIESVTREAPEQIGNGLKTLYARFSDLAMGKTDEDGIDLGKVTETLDAIGVKVLDEFGNIRNMDVIMEDLMDVWADLDETARIAAAQALAGKYQVNRFTALMNNRDMYEEYVGATGSNATGTLDRMNQEYADSLAGRTQKLQTSLEGLFSTVFNTDDIYPWIDAAQGAVDLLQEFFDALGGGKTVLLGISSLLMQIFSKNMAEQINNARINASVQKQKMENFKNSEAALTALGMANPNTNNQNSQEILGFAQFMAKNGQNFSNQQIDQTNKILADMVNNSNAAEQAMQNFRDTLDTMGVSLGNILKGGNKITPFMDEFGAINATELSEELRSMSDKDLTKALTDFQSKMADSREIIQAFGNDIMTFQNKINRTDFFEKIKSGEINLKQETDDLKDSLEKLKNTLSPDTYNRYKEILDKIANSTNNADEITDELVGDVTRLTEKLKNASISNIQEIKNFEEKAGKELTTAYNAQNAADDTAKIGQKYKEGYADQENIQNILNTLNAVQQLTFAWQTFQNLGSIWSNTDLTDGEKLLQTIMNLSVALPSLISGFSQLRNTLSKVISFFQNASLENRQKPFIDAAKASLEEAKAIEINKNKQKEAINVYQQKLRAQKENLEASQQEAQQEITVTELVIQHTQAEIDRLSILQEKNTTALETARANLTVADSLLEEAKAEKTLHEIRLNTLKQEYAMKEASGKLGAKERYKYESAIATSNKLIQNDDSEINIAQEMVNSAKSEVNQLTKEQAGITNRLSDARENLTKSTNKLSEAQEKLKTSEEQLRQIEQKMNSVVMGSIGVLSDLEGARKTVAKATEDYKEILKKAGQETATFKDLVNGIPIVFNNFAKGLIGKTGAALLGWIGIAAAAVAGIGAVIWTINKETKEQEERAKILEEINDKTKTTANTLTETLPTYQKLRDEFKSTGKASIDFIKSLEEQAKALGINDAEVDIAKGHYEELIKKIDEASSAALNAANILSVNNLKEANIGDVFSEEQKKELGLTTHIETTVLEGRGTDTGTSIMSSQEVYDQSAWEMIVLVQEKVKANEKELIELNKQYDQALSDQNESEALSLSRQIQNLQLKTQDYKNILDQYSDLANSVQEIGERALIDRANASEEGNQDFLNILREGTFEEVKESVKETLAANVALKESIGELSNEQIEALAASMMKLYENTNLTAEAIKENQDILGIFSEMEPTDSDIDVESFQTLGQYIYEDWENIEALNESLGEAAKFLEEDADYLADVTEAILRYQDALDEATEKMEDWEEALNDTNLEKKSKAVSELTDNMEDLLGLDAGTLGPDFVTAEENIQDFKDAIAGVEGAYDSLYEKALVQEVLHIEADNTQAMNAFDECMAALAEFDGYASTDIEMSVNDQQAISALENLLNSLGLVGDAAVEAARQMGYEIELEPGETVQDDTAEVVGYQPFEQTVPWHASIMPSADPSAGPAALQAALTPVTASGVYSGPGYTEQKHSQTATKTTGATGMKVTTGTGETSGGGVKIKSLKRVAPSGGAKSASSSRPSSSGGGGGGGKSCFVAGTLISTVDNFKNIEDIKVGDIVLSYNERTQQNEYSQVLQTMIHATIEPIYTLYIRNEQLRVTGIHRFLIKRNNVIDWIKAEDLRLGDWVLFANGTWHLILDIDVNVEAQIVYNFEVSHNHNYYVGEHQILAHNKGGGGGGSGSGSKGKTVEAKEHEKHQKKYYEEVEHQLDKTSKILDNVEKTTDKMIGTKARAKQNEQIKLLQKEIQLQEKKLKILQEQEKVDVEKAIKEADRELEKLLSQEGITWKIPNIEFDEDGIIKNTDEINKAIIDGQNKLIDKRNAIANRGEISELEEEEIKRIDKLIDKYKKFGDELSKNNDRYNDMIVEIEDLNNTIEELQDSIQDISIDMYKASQEAIDNLKELREEWAKFSAEFFYDKSKGEQMLSLDDPLTKAKELNNIMSSIYDISGSDARKFYQDIIEEQERLLKTATTDQEKKTYQNVIDYYKELQKGIDDNISINNGLLQIAVNDLRELQSIWDNWEENSRNNPIFGDNKAALKERLEDAQKRVQELALEYKENIEELMDNAVDIAERISDMWDQQLDRFDRVNDQLERYIDSYTLIFGDESYDAQAAVYEQQAKNLEQKLNTAEIAYEQARQRYLEAKERFTDPETGLVDRIFEEQVHALEEAMNDAEDAYRDTATEAAKLWVEAFEASVNAANKKALQTVFGSAGMDYVERNWEWEKEYNDKYRDDVEKAYELDKLRSKYINLLNDAQGASLQTQNKIRVQMQEQLDLLENQATVSEYDVKLANAKLEILQKQIALEDAQRNKNKMQLRRDTQGNYRYVYSANQNDVDQARQDLLDTEYDAYELSKNQQIANYDDLLNAFKRYQSQVLEISTNMNLSAEERERQLKELRDNYLEYLALTDEDFKDSTAGTLDILRYLVENGTDYTATSAKSMLEQILDEEGNLIEQSGIFWMDHAIQARDEIIPTIRDATTEAIDTIVASLNETQEHLVGSDGTGGLFRTISNGADTFTTACQNASDATKDLTTQTYQLQEALMADNKAFTDQIALVREYKDNLDQLSETSSNVAAVLRDTQAALERSEAEKLQYKTQIDRLLSGEDVIVDHKIISAEELRRQQEEEKRRQSSSGGGNRDAYYYADLIWDHGYWQGPNGWFDNFAAEFGYGLAQAVLDLFNSNYRGAWDAYIGGYDTGGYTGTWDNEGFTDGKNGKLAFLHQKELVLNATDTENILAAVSLMRELTNSAQGLFNGAVKQASASNISSTYNPTTEQRVEIQATFPNATDANDIREAILGLTDKAYQYAHRRI